MFIESIGTATPRTRYSQREAWEALSASDAFAALSTRSRALLKKVLLGRNGIESRWLALDPLDEVFHLSGDELHERFFRHAPGLGARACERALERSGYRPREIDALAVSTCTGYLCPGLTSYVSERLGLRDDCLLLDLVGQGCGAAIPNLRAAAGALSGAGAERALSVCVEVCSAAYYLDEDPGVLISACLFGDGAAAAALSDAPTAASQRHGRVEWVGASGVLRPADREALKFERKDGYLRNILRPEVPDVAAREAAVVLDRVLERAGMARADVTQWVLHAGGRDVLTAVGEAFGVGEGALVHSAEILREHGNMSSPSALFALERALREDRRPGAWYLASFGAGFSSHGALLRVE